MADARASWPVRPDQDEENRRYQPRDYPYQIILNPEKIGFGVMIDKTTMKVMEEVVPVGNHNIRLELNAQRKILSSYFALPALIHGQRGIREYKFTAEVTQMKALHYTSLENGHYSLVLPLPLPPQYFWRDEELRTTAQYRSGWRESDIWSRATDLSEDMNSSLAYPISLHSQAFDPKYIDIGRWTTFRFICREADTDSVRLLRSFRLALEDLNIVCETAPYFKFLPGSKPIMWERLDRPPISRDQGALALLEDASNVIYLDFLVRYQLEVCISRDLLNEHTVSEEFLRELAGMDPAKARLRLEFLADQGKPLSNPMTLFTNPDAEAYVPLLRLPHYCAMIRKAIVTPTTIRLNSPSVETSNRVLRKYNLLQDRFLRVQFLEESENGRIGTSKPQHDAVYRRLLRTMYRGIQIGDRKYEFLAFGSSQLRECGAYFFCPTGGTSCDDIRKWMGSFDHIRVVAKYAARLGQCFSTTREIRGIHVPRIRNVPDIERNGYCFTDGVGIISTFLAQIIVEEMVTDEFFEPSAFQFRMGGCKGVLCVWPQAVNMEVHIRQSQEKFKADFNGLEIIRCAKPATATLNRQTIIILECLGVPQVAFQELLDYQLRQFEMAMTDMGVAIRLLTQMIDENQTTLVIASLLKAKFIDGNLNEPFVRSVLGLWRSWSLKLLKEKARIQVEQSAFVLGCVDETGSLRGHYIATENSRVKDVNKLPQIFLQLSDPKVYKKTRIIKGVCIVGRNPSLHPGDIRVAQAVDEPKLRHLKDVVVFPSTGDRPLPNMLSGGDLDGDDFFVIWDSSLIPQEWNCPPMDYSGSKPRELDRDVNVDDMRNFFVSYAKNDVLPLVATSHLGFADNLGPKSQICLRLAKLHSKAVDFPKTGEPVEWNFQQQPRRWPHFMEKKNSYPSTKALGRIYNKVCRQSVEFHPDIEHGFDQRIFDGVQLEEKALQSAKEIKAQYDTSVRRILAQHNVGTEFELWSGFAMSKPAVGTDYKRQEHLGREYDSLRQRFRQMCLQAAGGKERLDAFVAAMYKVTEDQVHQAQLVKRPGATGEGESNADAWALEAITTPLITFPWIFPTVMIRLAQKDRRKPKGSVALKDASVGSADNSMPQEGQDEGKKIRADGNMSQTDRVDGGLGSVNAVQ